MFNKSLALTVAVALAAAQPAAAQKSPTVHQELLKQAPKVFDYLRQHNARTVGVLKFLVQEGNGKPSDRTALLNTTLADRLEIALALAIPYKIIDTRDCPVILHRPSEVAAKLPGANHLTAAGRAVLFKGSYPPAFGDGKPVAADAFLTGLVRIRPDWKQLTVTLQGCHKNGKGLDNLATFTVDTDVSSLLEGGANYCLPAGTRGGLDEIRTRSARPRKAGKGGGHALLDERAPVALEVLYNGKPEPIAVGTDGEARVAEPTEDQEVTFRVRRRPGVKGALAVVLLVNGENTLFKQRGDALLCAKWILPEDQQELLIKGFQTDEKKNEAFTVLSQAASKAREKEFDYGHDLGLVSLVVYREQDGPTPTSLGSPNDEAVQGGQLPTKTPANLFALRSQLRSANTRGQDTRGLIVPGKAGAAAVQMVSFRADPRPVMSANVRYYARQK